MTDDMMTLRTLLEKSSDADLLREMIGFTAERLMALEVQGLTRAGHGERTISMQPIWVQRRCKPPRQRQSEFSEFPDLDVVMSDAKAPVVARLQTDTGEAIC